MTLSPLALIPFLVPIHGVARYTSPCAGTPELPARVQVAEPGSSDELPVITAQMQAAPLTVGESLELVVTVADGPEVWWGDPAEVGIARPILQIAAPDSVRLLGEPPEKRVTPLDFETNYLGYPYGRKLYEAETKVAFELQHAPAPGARIELNVILWLDNDDPESSRFVRRRFALDLQPGAEAIPTDASTTSWGPRPTLAVGDRAAPFVLPSHEGVAVSLEELCKTPILVFTYRAHW